MLELHRCFPAILLDFTWELESQLEVQRARDGPHNVTVRANGPLAFKLINNSEFPERETSSTLIMYRKTAYAAGLEWIGDDLLQPVQPALRLLPELGHQPAARRL